MGCGKCDLLVFFMELGIKDLVGVNLFPLNNEAFRNEESVNKAIRRIKYIQCDVDKEPLPFPDESFDLVFLIDVLEHLYDPSFALKEITRVIKSGGYLCLRTPNCANLKNRIGLLLGKSPDPDLEGWLFDHRFYVPKTGERKFQGHMREYTIKELRKLLSYFSFKLLQIKLHPVEHYHKHQILLKIYNTLERLYNPFAYSISIIAIKKVKGED